MTKGIIGKALVKAVMSFRELYYTTINRIFLGLIWDLGKSCAFEGAIYVPAVKGNVKVGDNVRFGPYVRIGATEGAKIIIGDNVSVNQGSFIISRESIVIGNNTRVGEYVSIRDNDHEWRDKNTPILQQGFITNAVEIGSDVWIGRNVVISNGVKIGDGAVIGANAVITKNVNQYEVVVGNPGRVIKVRGE